jgi:hypothetical protein
MNSTTLQMNWIEFGGEVVLVLVLVLLRDDHFAHRPTNGDPRRARVHIRVLMHRERRHRRLVIVIILFRDEHLAHRPTHGRLRRRCRRLVVVLIFDCTGRRTTMKAQGGAMRKVVIAEDDDDEDGGAPTVKAS